MDIQINGVLPLMRVIFGVDLEWIVGVVECWIDGLFFLVLFSHLLNLSIAQYLNYSIPTN